MGIWRTLPPLRFMPDRLRVLMLASYFPKPANRLMGTWALLQATALRRRMDLQVVSLTSWVPRALSAYKHAAAYADCPAQFEWGDVPVQYPRALWYPVPPLKQYAFRNPRPQMQLAWQSVRPSLIRAVREFQPQVIYAHHTAVNGFLASRLKDVLKIPFVVTDHDFDEIAGCAHLPARKRFFANVVGQSSMMVAVATRMERQMRELFPEARTCTIQNGTEPIPEAIRNSPRPEELRGKTVLFSCGAFYERKGFPLLVEAFAEVAPRFPNAVLRIAGDGEQRAQVEELIRRFSLEDKVRLLGFLPHEDVLREMCQCDAFVLTGWDEPFATVFSEAMSAGKPVICCNDGGITDVLKNEVHGLTVPPKDKAAIAQALSRILEDASLRARLGQAAGKLFESALKWDHNAARMEAVFQAAAS